jgi:acetyl-CoA acetyltransferase
MSLVLGPWSSIVVVVHAYLLDAVRTPFGRHRGGPAGVRTDDLAALPIIELVRRHPGLAQPDRVDDVILVLPKPDVPFPADATLYHTQVGGA